MSLSILPQSIKSKRIKLRIKLNHSIPILNPQPIWMNITCQGARPNKNWFRSTHLTEKVRQLILIDQYLLFKIRYYVVPNCGTANEINGALYHDMAFKRRNEAQTEIDLKFHLLPLKCPKPFWKNDYHVPAYNLSVHMVRQHVTWLSHDHFFIKKQSPLLILTCFKSCWD